MDEQTYFRKLEPNDANPQACWVASVKHGDVTVTCRVFGDTVVITPADDWSVELYREDNVRSYGKPFYHSLEEFVERCEGHCRLATIRTNWGDSIAYIYDFRPQKEILHWPDGSRIDPEDRGYSTGGNFCYACNIDSPYDSEWGSCDFLPIAGETEYRQWEARMKQNFASAVAFVTNNGENDAFIVQGAVATEMYTE